MKQKNSGLGDEPPNILAMKQTEADIARARAMTRTRRQWLYVRSDVLERWLKREARKRPELAERQVDARAVRDFYADHIKLGATAPVERSADGQVWAVWTEERMPMYVREKDLPATSSDLTIEDAVLQHFAIDDDSTGVEAGEDDLGVYYALRTKTTSPDAPPIFGFSTDDPRAVEMPEIAFIEDEEADPDVAPLQKAMVGAMRTLLEEARSGSTQPAPPPEPEPVIETRHEEKSHG